MSKDKVSGSDKMIWVSKFDAAAAKEFYHDFVQLENDPNVTIIPIIIASYGGETHHLMGMRDLIKSSTKPVATIAFGMAMSSGAALLFSGTKGHRYAAPDACIMVHEVSTGWQGKTTDFLNEAKFLEEINDLFVQRMAEDCGKTKEEFFEKMSSLKNADWILTPKDAKQWGMIDHIGLPRPTSKSQVSGISVPLASSKKKK